MLAPIVEAGRRDPWNKGKLVGQKAPLKFKDIWAIRGSARAGRSEARTRVVQSGGADGYALRQNDERAIRES
jgi:hypothetical protein